MQQGSHPYLVTEPSINGIKCQELCSKKRKREFTKAKAQGGAPASLQQTRSADKVLKTHQDKDIISKILVSFIAKKRQPRKHYCFVGYPIIVLFDCLAVADGFAKKVVHHYSVACVCKFRKSVNPKFLKY